MRFTISPPTGKALAASVGAGLAAALLTLVSERQTALGFQAAGAAPVVGALVMGFISPLTIMIASIGFGAIPGLVAALVGGLVIGIVHLAPAGHAAFQADKLEPAGLEVLVFLVSLGLPAFALGRLAVRSVPPVPDLAKPFRAEERVLGTILSFAVGFAALSMIIAFAVEMIGAGGFTMVITSLVAKAEPLVQPLIASNKAVFRDIDPHRLAVLVVWGAMPFLAARAVVILVVNLWLAARIAQMSGLLTSPWPDVPRFLRAPRPLGLVFAAALGLSFAGNVLGMVGLILSGALAMGFVLQGLAIVHALTRGKSVRFPLLIILYLCTILLFPWPLVAFGLLGLLDTGFAFRDRQKPIVKKLKP